MHRWRSRFALTVALSVYFVVAPASAQRIVLLRPATADVALLQAFGRLQGELRTYDFEVVVVDGGNVAPSPRQLAKVAEDARAVATVSLVRSEGLATADVWISDRVTGKTTMRTIATSENREASSVLAVRAVDLLRTSLREFPEGERPPPDVVGASPDRAPPHVREWAATKPVRKPWSVEAGIAVQSTLSSLGALFGPCISLAYNPAEQVGVAVGFQGPLSGTREGKNGTSTSLRNEQVFAELRYRPIVRAGWAVEVTADIGAHHLSVEGAARLPYVGRSDSAWTALFAAGPAFELRIFGGASLLLFGRAVLLAPRPVVHAVETATAYGRPALQTGGSLRVNF
jgi:hypothetical protein